MFAFSHFYLCNKKRAHVCVFVCWIQYNEALFSNQRRREFITLVNEGARAGERAPKKQQQQQVFQRRRAQILYFLAFCALAAART